jgi:hypothetical protein
MFPPVIANNSYARGISLTLANDCVGTGPRLQMLTADAFANRFVEQEFFAWADAVGLAEKLRTMRLARVSDGDPFAGVDLDDCLDEDGNFLWGEDVVNHFDSYCEISPSGLGVKLFIRGEKPAHAQCRIDGLGPKTIGKLEVYDRAR